ncbi:energy-coupling factor ABC transporter ATP-binding protein [Corticicoccus populi]|uniref:Energy-coupling factor ABC transporter ATP-binding protein n=1 Tax=Corticicoccus populi TaxID=1812821 RepID=A0ABW5WUB7_9STAP
MSYLSLKEVSYSYPNGHEAVKNLNLDFELGESAAVVGQNGAGKTTAVKMMNGLLRPSEGLVLLEGKSIASMTTAEVSQYVGYVFQNPDEQIFQDTIYKEIAFGLKKKKLKKDDINRIVKEAALLCGLENDLEEHPYNLPYSKRKFITIAAVTAMNPNVIILDEPTAGQDRGSIQRLGEIIKELTQNNKTVITITHDMEFVASEFERVIVLADKQKRKEGTPKEIFWDEELLSFSDLKQPYICQLAGLLGHKDIITIEELLEVRHHETTMD